MDEVMTFLQSTVSTVLGWFNSFFGAVLPSGAATDEKKSQFMKYGFILVCVFFAAKIFRVNIGTGGKK